MPTKTVNCRDRFEHEFSGANVGIKARQNFLVVNQGLHTRWVVIMPKERQGDQM